MEMGLLTMEMRTREYGNETHEYGNGTRDYGEEDT